MSHFEFNTAQTITLTFKCYLTFFLIMQIKEFSVAFDVVYVILYVLSVYSTSIQISDQPQE